MVTLFCTACKTCMPPGSAGVEALLTSAASPYSPTMTGIVPLASVIPCALAISLVSADSLAATLVLSPEIQL